MKIFISYTREKDEFNNAVTALRDHLANELSLRDSQSAVFLDTHDIGVGANFPEELEIALAKANVLIVLISPAWLESKWCRKEFDLFTDERNNTARMKQILPVLWVDTPALSSPGNDPIAACLANLNYADWCDLRHENWDNPVLRKKVDALATRAIELGGSNTI